jgi:hypothetical protein
VSTLELYNSILDNLYGTSYLFSFFSDSGGNDQCQNVNEAFLRDCAGGSTKDSRIGTGEGGSCSVSGTRAVC